MPDGQVEAFETHFLQGRVVFKQLIARQRLARRHRKGFDSASFNLTHRVGGLVAHQINLTAYQGIHRRTSATKGNGGHGFFGLYGCLPHQAAQVRR